MEKTKPIIEINQGTTESPSTVQSCILTTKNKRKIFLKLNLGCGGNPRPGYVNVDKYGNPDILHDLDTFPWPWEDNSVNEIQLIHVLEHLGERKEVFLNIIKELYRICVASATIHIVVPHSRHDDFMNDPTHVRVITPKILDLFSKSKNRECIKRGDSDSLLALYLHVDFEIIKADYTLAPYWLQKLVNKEITEKELYAAIARYNNVMGEIRMVLKVLK